MFVLNLRLPGLSTAHKLYPQYDPGLDYCRLKKGWFSKNKNMKVWMNRVEAPVVSISQTVGDDL